MTAHHGDDLIETILMRLVRGSSLSGYKGIPLISDMKTYKIIRPLLYLTKDDIETFDKVNKIPYRVDKSNFSFKYTRNRYRHEMLPFLKEEASNVHLKFLKFSNLLNECNNYIEKVVDNAYNSIYKEGKVDVLEFKSLDIFIQKLLLEKILLDVYHDLNKIESKHIDIILKLINSGKSGSKISLPKGVEVILDYDYLIFKKEIVKKEEYELELKDGLVIPNGMKFIKYEGNENGNDTMHINSKDVKLPLYVRNKRNGDIIELKGTNGLKKVSSILIDKKVSSYKRDGYPVVVDSDDKIIWVPNLKKSKYDSQNSEKCDIIYKCL